MQKKESTHQSFQKASSSRRRASQNTRSSQPPETPLVSQPSVVPQTPEEWRAHWKAQRQPWRTEPEIDALRQEELTKRRAIAPDVEKGIYPFSGIKLNRADIEWLLATHENGRGPVDWSDESQRERKGLDVRGADLSGSEYQHLSLAGLPLARLIGGLNLDEWLKATEKQRKLDIIVITLETEKGKTTVSGIIKQQCERIGNSRWSRGGRALMKTPRALPIALRLCKKRSIGFR